MVPAMEPTADGAVLRDFFEHGDHRLIHKWMHFFEIYDRHFAKFRGKPVSVLELGVYHGGSLQMWKHYFGEQARIFGADIDPRCAALSEPNITVFIGDQEDRSFHRALRATLPKLDVIIDDGGHTMGQQIVTFEELYGHLNEGGIYLAEDLHTSYMAHFGGGHRNPGSFIEYAKRLIDQLNAWHSSEASLAVDDFTRSAFGLHFYDSVLVIERRAISAPGARMRGTPSFPLSPAEEAVYKRG